MCKIEKKNTNNQQLLKINKDWLLSIKMFEKKEKHRKITEEIGNL